MEEFSNTVVAILLTVCNKYEPGQQVFRLQSLVGLKENTNMVDKVSLSKANLTISILLGFSLSYHQHYPAFCLTENATELTYYCIHLVLMSQAGHPCADAVSDD